MHPRWIFRVFAKARIRNGIDHAIRGAALVALGIGGTASAETLVLTGDLGHEAQVLQGLAQGAVIDARSALFRVANSGQSAPTSALPCDSGDLVVNPYPLQIRNSADVTVLGGVFAGEVPQTSDWQDTYCNSAAIDVRDGPGVTVEAVRMRRLWDALRFSKDSNRFVLRGSWISETRDDCIENDYLNAGRIEDMLLDGCFAGLSMRPPKGEDRTAAGDAVVLRGVLMRMQGYLYKGEQHEAPPFKVIEAAPRIAIHDSILAMGDAETLSKARVAIGWAQIGECSDNLLLWTSDAPWPEDLAPPPACFQVVKGAEARAIWQQARQNWINCHPDIQRFPEDPLAVAAQCNPDAYGGKVIHNR